MTDTIADYLERKGAIELIDILAHNHASISFIEEETTASRPTIFKRLKEGRRIGIMEQTLATDEDSNIIDYTLSTEGEDLHKLVKDSDVLKLQSEIDELNKELDSEQTQVAKNFSQL